MAFDDRRFQIKTAQIRCVSNACFRTDRPAVEVRRPALRVKKELRPLAPQHPQLLPTACHRHSRVETPARNASSVSVSCKYVPSLSWQNDRSVH